MNHKNYLFLKKGKYVEVVMIETGKIKIDIFLSYLYSMIVALNLYPLFLILMGIQNSNLNFME